MHGHKRWRKLIASNLTVVLPSTGVKNCDVLLYNSSALQQTGVSYAASTRHASVYISLTVQQIVHRTLFPEEPTESRPRLTMEVEAVTHASLPA